jgi:Putative restriction endonuclease
MVVVWPEPIQAGGSYDLPLQPTRPLWVLEYVSPSNKRKDYEDSFRKYERHLKVPYYLLFYPDNQELTLYHHNGKRYVSVKPNADARYAIPELDLELALLDGWVRFWYQGELLPLPADLQRALDEARRQLGEARQELGQTRQQLEEETRRANTAEEELARLRSELEHLRGRPGSGSRG